MASSGLVMPIRSASPFAASRSSLMALEDEGFRFKAGRLFRGLRTCERAARSDIHHRYFTLGLPDCLLRAFQRGEQNGHGHRS
jgi:hypothetical protein